MLIKLYKGNSANGLRRNLSGNCVTKREKIEAELAGPVQHLARRTSANPAGVVESRQSANSPTAVRRNHYCCLKDDRLQRTQSFPARLMIGGFVPIPVVHRRQQTTMNELSLVASEV
ncbi:MAG: hypothetical protein ABI673_07040 [Novosphingobium sp.]